MLAAYRLSFGASLVAAAINVVFGLLVAWVLVRYVSRPQALFDAIVDLPFALPTAVAGIALDRDLRRERLDRPLSRAVTASRSPSRRWAWWWR